MSMIDLTGKRFGRLTVISRADIKDRDQRTRWHCLCDCGKMIVVTGNALQQENTKSCGCLRKDLGREKIHEVRETVYTDGTNTARLNDKPCGNSSSGVRGVSWNKAVKKWRATIKYKGKAYLQNRRRGIGCSRVKKCGKHDKKYKEEFNHEDHDV